MHPHIVATDLWPGRAFHGPPGHGYISVSLQRQANRECGANTRRAVHFERTVVILDDFFCNVESEAGSTLALFGREIGIENLVNPSRGDPVTIVFHAKVHIEILPRAIR